MPKSASAEQRTDDTTIAEIVVTARRREERLLDVPVSATVLGPEALARYAPANLQDVQGEVPGLVVSRIGSGNGASLSLRGVSATNSDAGVEQMVSVVVDDVATSRGRVLDAALFDTQSLDVLKGPQALFFGKNSPGGVISITTASPGDTFEGYVRANYTFENDRALAEGAVSIPVSDTFGVRIAGRASKEFGGFVKNTAVSGPDTDDPSVSVPVYHRTLGHAEMYSGRLTLAWKPTSDFDATAKVLVDHYSDDGENVSALLFRCPGDHPTLVGIGTDMATTCRLNYKESRSGLPSVYAAHFPGSNGGVPFSKTNTVLSSLSMHYRWDSFVLTSVTGYYDYKHDYYDDFDHTSFNVVSASQPEDHRGFSQEVRLLSSFKGPLNFSLGGLYQHERREFNPDNRILSLPQAFLFDPVTGRYDQTEGSARNRGETLSAYAQLSWQIQPEFELAGGARYTHERKRVNEGLDYVHQAIAPFFSAAGERLIGSRSFNNVSPEVTLTWKPRHDQTIYAAYKTGYLSGGFSNPGILLAGTTIDALSFRPAKVKGGELGYKAAINDLSLDATAFWYDYQDLQLQAFDAFTNPPRFRTLNAAKARSRGVEVQGNYRLGDLSLRGSVLYTDAKYRDYPNAQCFVGQTAAQGCFGTSQDMSGVPIDMTSKWNVGAGLSYDIPVAGSWTFAPTADVRYASSYNPSAATSAYDPSVRQDDYINIDAALRAYNSKRTLEVSLVGRNLTDHERLIFVADAPSAAPGTKLGYRTEPRTVGLQIETRF